MRHALVAVACAAVVTGCSAVVDPDDMRLPCVISDGWDPCPVGMVCEASYCVREACSPSTELCNGEDDDCDGVIDNGHDMDEDGFTWCGGGDMALADCDDTSDTAHPGDPSRGVAPGVETCDGRDNDCDSMIDEGVLCPSGQSCVERACVDPADCTQLGNECPRGEVCDTAMAPPRCVPGMGMDCREDFVCTSPMECDATTGNCITPVTPLGMPCVSDGECSVGYCARADSVGLESRSARLCSMACCTDSDCPGESICFASDAGVKMCLPGSLVGRTKGPGTSFTACGSGPECQSGLCGGGDGCVGNCALDAHCGSGNTCMIANVNGVAQFVCQQGATGGGSGAPCGGGCRSGICLTPGDLCGAACRTTADCPSGWYCGWLEFTDGSGSVQVCSPRPGGAGSGTDGDFCLSDLDCRDLQCVRSYAECWDSCCSDADCGGGRCKAVYISRGRFETHCEP